MYYIKLNILLHKTKKLKLNLRIFYKKKLYLFT